MSEFSPLFRENTGERRNAYKLLVGKPEGKRSLGRPRHSWKDNIRMGLKEMRWERWSGFFWLRVGINVRFV
jgi:hypothetical protein